MEKAAPKESLKNPDVGFSLNVEIDETSLKSDSSQVNYFEDNVGSLSLKRMSGIFIMAFQF